MDIKRKFKKMVEWMRNGYKEEGGMVDCCSMMKKRMGQKKRGEKKRKRGAVKRRIEIGGLHVFQVKSLS